MYKYGKGQEIINLAFESDSKLLLNSFFSMISSMDKSSIAMLVTPGSLSIPRQATPKLYHTKIYQVDPSGTSPVMRLALDPPDING
jgi:hypothetical protein